MTLSIVYRAFTELMLSSYSRLTLSLLFKVATQSLDKLQILLACKTSVYKGVPNPLFRPSAILTSIEVFQVIILIS